MLQLASSKREVHKRRHRFLLFSVCVVYFFVLLDFSSFYVWEREREREYDEDRKRLHSEASTVFIRLQQCAGERGAWAAARIFSCSGQLAAGSGQRAGQELFGVSRPAPARPCRRQPWFSLSHASPAPLLFANVPCTITNPTSFMASCPTTHACSGKYLVFYTLFNHIGHLYEYVEYNPFALCLWDNVYCFWEKAVSISFVFH